MRQQPAPWGRGEDVVWSMVGSLVGGPLAWGAIGWFVDQLLGTTRVFLPIGVVLGFVTGIAIVYLRYGRDERRTNREHGS